jgi:hypothetical protein
MRQENEMAYSKFIHITFIYKYRNPETALSIAK